MTDFSSHSTPKAGTAHVCDSCNGWIAKGAVHHKVTGKWEGQMYTQRHHIDCMDMARAVYDADGYCVDDGLPYLADLEQEQLNAWRGRFPHAVTRVEYRKQMAEIRREKRRSEIMRAGQ